MTIHPNNVKRVIRALEYYYETGQKISEHNEEQKQKESPYCSAYFVLNDERSILYDRIDRRVDQMIHDGLVDEVSRLKEMGYTREGNVHWKRPFISSSGTPVILPNGSSPGSDGKKM